MSDVFALEKLFLDVQARLAAEGTGDADLNAFGWRVPAQQATKARIAWVPGDAAGNLGESGPARQPGRNPRPLATVFEQFTVEIQAANALEPESELAQYKAVRLLRDAWHRACLLAARDTFRIVSEAWITDKKERRYGAAIRVVCSIEAMVPDVAHELVPSDAQASLDLEELDNVEHQDVTAASAPPS